jgi:hypothetical protein
VLNATFGGSLSFAYLFLRLFVILLRTMSNNPSYPTPGGWPGSNNDNQNQASGRQSSVPSPPIIIPSPGHRHAGQYSSQSFAFPPGQQGSTPYPQNVGHQAGSNRSESGRSNSWIGWFWELIGPRNYSGDANAGSVAGYAGGNLPGE